MKHPSNYDDLLLPGPDAPPSRRAFLSYAGFGIGAAALASCSRRSDALALPWASAPEELVAGRAWWIATTCAACPAACGALARCRDGRPVKLEGNELDPNGAVGLCAVGQASLLELYDSRRPAGPLASGRSTTWAELDGVVADRVRALATGGKLRVLTGTMHSPSTRAAIAQLTSRCADARHVTYDALSASAALDAHAATHGVRALPEPDFARARVIASFDADFLGTWIAPVHFTAQYAKRRGVGAERSHHVQLESRLSLTGSRADERHVLAPHELAPALERLCSALALHAGRGGQPSGLDERLARAIDALAARLWDARGESLVLCGANELSSQLATNRANELLGNYGRTLDLERPSLRRQGDDASLQALARELAGGEVDLLVIAGCNPAYDAPRALASQLAKAKLLVSCPQTLDETAALAAWVAPQPHYLETWDDAEPVSGSYGLTQPTMPMLRDNRTLRRSLHAWLGDTRGERELVAEHWRTQIAPRFGGDEPFDAFFRRALHDGVAKLPRERVELLRPSWRDPSTPDARPQPATELALVLHPSHALLDGAHAHNPWLQELPDPLSKCTWGNCATLSPARAARLGLVDGDLVRLSVEGLEAELELPVLVQRGQHDDVVAVALGHGGLATERFAQVGPQWLEGQATPDASGRVGANAAALLAFSDGLVRAGTGALHVRPTGARIELARTQAYDSLTLPEGLAPHGHEERGHVQTFDATSGAAQHQAGGHAAPGLWPDDHAAVGPKWGMVIDLARCTGCSACVIGCQAENNVPVVGRDEVRRHRDMHWIRIDRYIAGEGGAVRADFQPMLCQHCANAPCEAVCPVLATVHSAEGLNQQVYNRCVGTRYCANTCPYKVRRFNWFDYPRDDRLANLALNPDVTVRSRGVMEKCSFCAQRIQEARLEARRRGVVLTDGDVRTACQQTCPAQAIAFGDFSDPDSAASRLAADPRAYTLLEELNVRPAIHYLARVSATEVRHER